MFAEVNFSIRVLTEFSPVNSVTSKRFVKVYRCSLLLINIPRSFVFPKEGEMDISFETAVSRNLGK